MKFVPEFIDFSSFLCDACCFKRDVDDDVGESAGDLSHFHKLCRSSFAST